MFNDLIALYFKKTPMVCMSLAFVLGIFTALFLPYFHFSLVLASFSTAFLMFQKKDSGFTLVLLFSIWAIGWSYHSYKLELTDQQIENTLRLNERNISYKGVLLSKSTTKYGQKLVLKNHVLLSDSITFDQKIKYIVYLKENYEIEIGDTLSGQGKFLTFSFIRNPGEFDFRSFYHRKGIFGKIYQDKASSIKIKTPVKTNFLYSVGKVRGIIRAYFNKYMDKDVAGLLSALILGDKSDVDPELRTAFVETGVIHVLAVSGLHVGYVLLILVILAKLFRIPWGWDRLAIIFGLIGFIILTGFKPSVIRASIMAGLYVIAPVVNRPVNTWNIIATAALVILASEPSSIADLGFLLSFSAVISIIFFLGIFDKILPDKLKVNKIRNKPIKFIWGLFLVSLSAQIGTLPFTAMYFGRIPIISLIANLVIVPLVGLLVALGFAILLLGWVPFLGYWYGTTAWLLTKIIQTVATIFSSVPYASLPVSGFGWVRLVQYGLMIVFLFMVFLKSYRGRAILVSGVILTISIYSWALEKRGMNVIFLDVGQGDAAIVCFENGKTMLIDAGQRNWRKDFGARVVVPVARHLGINRFNWVVMTHPHSDHVGGLVTVLEEIPVDTVWDTYSDFGSWTYNHLLEVFPEKGIICLHPNRGDTFLMDDDTYIQILAPDSVLVEQEYNVNNLSIVFRLVYGKTSFLFSGDLEQEGDRLLLSLSHYLDSDVLKVAHHGSITGTTQALLDLISPDIAVISVGYRNKFNHPSPIVIDRLEKADVHIFRTDIQGAVWFHSNGEFIEEVLWR